MESAIIHKNLEIVQLQFKKSFENISDKNISEIFWWYFTSSSKYSPIHVFIPRIGTVGLLKSFQTTKQPLAFSIQLFFDKGT